MPRALVEECLRIALQAPSGSNAQRWHWVVLTDPELRAAVGEHYGGRWRRRTTLHLRYEREVAELLGLPEHVRQGALVPTAYCTGDTFHPAARQPLAEVLHVDGW